MRPKNQGAHAAPLAWLALVACLVGCNLPIDWGNGPHNSPQPPTPVVEPAARQCLDQYGRGIAAAFEAAAVKFDAHEPSPKIADQMGDELKAARIQSFLPLMERLNAANSKTDAERDKADAERAALLRKWAKELRGEP